MKMMALIIVSAIANAKLISVLNRWISAPTSSLLYVIIAGIFGLIGFVVWDRRNATKPVRQDIDRLFQVMRKLAGKDQ